jgi:hypothetical protein
MPIYTKKSDGTWSTNAKKIFVKAADGLWKSATRLLAKTPSGWVQMWPGDAPANNPNDPVNIRLNSYSGTVASSPQFINTVLYGHDNNGASVIGATPITITNRKMQLATDNTGQTDRYQVESTDIYDLTSNSESNVAEKRFYADAWWLFYQLDATNIWGTTRIFSANPIKIIKQQPTFSANSPSLSGDYSGTNPFLSLSFSFSDTWWKSADLSRSYIKWWQNTSKTPGGTPLKTTYIDVISGLSTTRSGGVYEDYDGSGTTVSGNDYYTVNGGIPAGQYIIAEVVLINSYTDHYNSPVSAFVSSGDNPTITDLSVLDDNGNSVVDNQSPARIMSDGYLNFTATVSDAASSTYYLLEPRMYNWVNGSTYEFNTSTVIGSNSWPTDLTPYSTVLNGTTATVKWRIYIDANTLYAIGGPTYSGGQARWQFEFRVSARASSTATNASASYFTGIASLGGDTVYLQGLDLPAMVNVHPSSAMTLNVSSTTPSLGSSVTFSGTTVGYPTSTYSSFPRRYIIEYGDGTDSGWQYFSTGTSNPSFSGITKTYSNAGTYTATLKWEPQGDPSRSTRSRTITVAAAPTKLATPTNVSATDTRTDGVNITWSAVSGADYYGVWYGPPAPSYDSNPDFGGPNNPSVITGTSYLDTAIGSGVTRDYYVQAFRTNNPTGTKSEWSAGDSGTRAVASTPPSGGSVSLSPSGTVQARTTITASVTAMTGTATITYFTSIRKRTGSAPTSITDGTEVASGTGTGNVATHVITDSEASGTPDQFRAFTTGTNSAGSNTVASNTVISTPYVEPVVTPSGGTATSTPSTGTAGTTTYIGSTSGWSGSPTSYSYSWQYFSQSSFSWVAVASGSSFSPASNINTLYPNYGWQLSVGATNSAGTGYATTSITVNSPATPSIPATPTNVAVSTSGLVTWDAVSGADTYEVLNYTDRSSAPANTTNRLGPYTTTGITGTSLQLSSTQGYAGSNNYARAQVRARNSAGVSTYSAWFPSSTTYV